MKDDITSDVISGPVNFHILFFSKKQLEETEIKQKWGDALALTLLEDQKVCWLEEIGL